MCSTHPDGISSASTCEGIKLLNDIIASRPEILGSHVLGLTEGKGELPILIKLIDAEKSLSVQVHPDDEYAKEYENGSWGKTEMWYVLSAQAGAEAYLRF